MVANVRLLTVPTEQDGNLFSLIQGHATYNHTQVKL